MAEIVGSPPPPFFEEQGAREIILYNVVPGIGNFVAILMFTSPLRAVLVARHQRDIGTLGYFPLSMMFINCCVWLAYGFLKGDPYVVANNFYGTVIASFYVLTVIPLVDIKAQDMINTLILGVVCLLCFGGSLTVFAVLDYDNRLTMWGICGILVTTIFYAAPLSGLWDVIATKNASSILLPLTIGQLTNGTLWTMYAFATMDVYLGIPNAAGIALACLQLTLRCIYDPTKLPPNADRQDEEMAESHKQKEKVDVNYIVMDDELTSNTFPVSTPPMSHTNGVTVDEHHSGVQHGYGSNGLRPNDGNNI
jgi:solute carrier family 50 protein (sugar transporter)